MGTTARKGNEAVSKAWRAAPAAHEFVVYTQRGRSRAVGAPPSSLSAVAGRRQPKLAWLCRNSRRHGSPLDRLSQTTVQYCETLNFSGRVTALPRALPSGSRRSAPPVDASMAARPSPEPSCGRPPRLAAIFLGNPGFLAAPRLVASTTQFKARLPAQRVPIFQRTLTRPP